MNQYINLITAASNVIYHCINSLNCDNVDAVLADVSEQLAKLPDSPGGHENVYTIKRPSSTEEMVAMLTSIINALNTIIMSISVMLNDPAHEQDYLWSIGVNLSFVRAIAKAIR